MDISTVQLKSDIHTWIYPWIYPWIYQWISMSTATLIRGQGHPRTQGHRSWCQSKQNVRLPSIVINGNFGRIFYCFRDVDV